MAGCCYSGSAAYFLTVDTVRKQRNNATTVWQCAKLTNCTKQEQSVLVVIDDSVDRFLL